MGGLDESSDEMVAHDTARRARPPAARVKTVPN